jgi:hypothetical protein
VTWSLHPDDARAIRQGASCAALLQWGRFSDGCDCALSGVADSPDVIPEFPIEPEIALELLMASNYLDA